jgi:hypothetical protein
MPNEMRVIRRRDSVGKRELNCRHCGVKIAYNLAGQD